MPVPAVVLVPVPVPAPVSVPVLVPDPVLVLAPAPNMILRSISSSIRFVIGDGGGTGACTGVDALGGGDDGDAALAGTRAGGSNFVVMSSGLISLVSLFAASAGGG